MDPLLVLAGMAALCAAIYGRALWAGVFLGAAIMTKQQGVLYAPLVLGALWLARDTGRRSKRKFVRSVCALIAGLALVTLPIVYWDSLRWSVAPSPWDLSVRNYAALALLPPTDWPARALEWSPLLWNLAASWAVWAAWAGLLLAAILAAHNADNYTENVDRRRYAAITLFGLWSLAFVAVHIVTTVQPWDRYLLPLAPMLALAAGWAIDALGRPLSIGQMAAVVCAWLVLVTAPALNAAQGRLPVGADHGDYAGLTEAIEAVRNASEQSFVLYHRELGSHYRFYLFDETAGEEAGTADLRWFPNSVYLADNAAKSPYPGKFLIEPAWGFGLQSGTPSRYARSRSGGTRPVWPVSRAGRSYCSRSRRATGV